MRLRGKGKLCFMQALLLLHPINLVYEARRMTVVNCKEWSQVMQANYCVMQITIDP